MRFLSVDRLLVYDKYNMAQHDKQEHESWANLVGNSSSRGLLDLNCPNFNSTLINWLINWTENKLDKFHIYKSFIKSNDWAVVGSNDN